MEHPQAIGPQPEADQTVRLQIDTATGCPSIRIGFTDQRLTAHGGMVVWSHFLHQKRFRHELNQVLPHDPASPNAYVPTDIALIPYPKLFTAEWSGPPKRSAARL